MNRQLQWLTGISLYSIFNFVFDYGVYSLAIWKLGVLCGGLVMAVLAFLVDWLSIRFYDWAGTDWLALEQIKSLRAYRGKNWLKVVAATVLTKTPIVVQLVLLSIRFNPFIVTTFLRPVAFQYGGMTQRDWVIFISSHLIGQVYWVLLISGAVYSLLTLFSPR